MVSSGRHIGLPLRQRQCDTNFCRSAPVCARCHCAVPSSGRHIGLPLREIQCDTNFCRGAPACAPCHCAVLSLGRHVCAQNTSKQRNNNKNNKKAIEFNRTIGFIAYPLRVLPLYYKKEGEFELPVCPYGKGNVIQTFAGEPKYQ